MDYKEMWDKLKEEIEHQLESHKSGAMESMAESIQGELECREILSLMAQIEEDEMNK